MRTLRLRGVLVSSPRLVDGRAEIFTHARGSSHDLPPCVLGDFALGAESKQPSTGVRAQAPGVGCLVAVSFSQIM